MSGRVKKSKPKSKVKAAERDDLLSTILRSVIAMKTLYSSYKARGLTYEVSSSAFSICYEYVRSHQSFCDA